MTNKDEPPEPEPEDRPLQNLLVTISRTVGLTARTVANGFQEFTSAVKPRRPSSKSRKKESLDITLLLHRLGQIVSEHKDGNYQALVGDEEFWKLVAKLQTARRAQSIENAIKEGTKTASAKRRNVRTRRREQKHSAGPGASEAAAPAETAPSSEAGAEAETTDRAEATAVTAVSDETAVATDEASSDGAASSAKAKAPEAADEAPEAADEAPEAADEAPEAADEAPEGETPEPTS